MRDRKVKKKPKRRSKKLKNKFRMQKNERRTLTGEKPRLNKRDWQRRLKEELRLLTNSYTVPNPRIILVKMDHIRVLKSKTSRQNSQ